LIFLLLFESFSAAHVSRVQNLNGSLATAARCWITTNIQRLIEREEREREREREKERERERERERKREREKEKKREREREKR
jgi:hypothetical protein